MIPDWKQVGRPRLQQTSPAAALEALSACMMRAAREAGRGPVCRVSGANVLDFLAVAICGGRGEQRQAG